MLWGVIPKSDHYFNKVVFDRREADLKIVDYKDEELQV